LIVAEWAGASEGITYTTFDGEGKMAEIVALIDKDLSEPYSIFTYREIFLILLHLHIP